MITFTKMSGTMNDFIVIDNRNQILDPDHLGDWIQKICRRKYSVGADGLILIENSTKAHFKWRFFNCDGLEADMCGNGARCAARYGYLQGFCGPHVTFETQAGLIEAVVQDQFVKIQMPAPSGIKLDLEIMTENNKITFSKINTGVPHAVVDVTHLDEFSLETLKSLGKTLRFHKFFQPEGTNVTFVEVLDRSTLKTKTYERGVEDITYSCGTGVTAAAWITHEKGLTTTPLTILTPGGNLKVYIEGDIKKNPSVFLEGDARIIYTGELHDEAV
ncbi:MAG: diaminopimelate epimerase [Deltaproteobacteria bacterium]|nr:diaminopimelate epimerase [Deltaproteobacteria bacterium]